MNWFYFDYDKLNHQVTSNKEKNLKSDKILNGHYMLCPRLLVIPVI